MNSTTHYSYDHRGGAGTYLSIFKTLIHMINILCNSSWFHKWLFLPLSHTRMNITHNFTKGLIEKKLILLCSWKYSVSECNTKNKKNCQFSFENMEKITTDWCSTSTESSKNSTLKKSDQLTGCSISARFHLTWKYV